MDPERPVVFSLGHSNRTILELIELIRTAGLRTIADVRRFPRSRRHPWFDAELLRESLAEAGIGYRHFPDLGGHRDPPPREALALVGALPEPGSAYAAWARSDAFAAALTALVRVAVGQGPLGLLCAERDPVHCHRSLLADALSLRGLPVVHLLSPEDRREHEPHPLATHVRGRLAYPPRQASLFP